MKLKLKMAVLHRPPQLQYVLLILILFGTLYLTVDFTETTKFDRSKFLRMNLSNIYNYLDISNTILSKLYEDARFSSQKHIFRKERNLLPPGVTKEEFKKFLESPPQNVGIQKAFRIFIFKFFKF